MIIARRADTKPDWSEGYESEEVYADCHLINSDPDVRDLTRPSVPKAQEGGLVAFIPCSEIRRRPGRKNSFQIALALGHQKDDSAWWSNHDRALKQTVARIEIEGPPQLSPSMQLLSGLPNPLGWRFEPAPLIRAINHFRKLGKEESIIILREFLEKAPDPGYGGFREPDPESLDMANQWCLSILLPFVFQSSNPKPRPFRSEYVAVYQGIPFHTALIAGTSGRPPNVKPLVDWAENEGTIESEQLDPTNRPLDAADKLYALLLQKMSKEERESEQTEGFRSIKAHLRAQAYSLVRHLVEQPEQDEGQHRQIEITDDRWRDLKARLERMTIRWNNKRGMYEKQQ